MSFRRRVCFIFAVVFIALIPLAVSSFALNQSDYNLVPSDVLLWTSFSDNGKLNVGAVSNSNLVRFISSQTSPNVGNQHVAECLKTSIPSGFLVSGQSYSLSFYYPSDNDIISSVGGTSALIKSHWDRIVACSVGLAIYHSDPSNPYFTMIPECSVQFDYGQRIQYGGHINYINFVMPDVQGSVYFVVGFLRGGDNSGQNPIMYFGRYYGLVDFQRKQQLEDYNNLWFGNSDGEYSNPYTTETYDVGVAGDTNNIDNAVSQWESGLGEFGTPLRVAGVFLNSLFSTGGIVTIGVIILVILMFGVIFRLLGVT